MSETPKEQTEAGQDVRYVLKLYVSGATPRSAQAIASIKDICEGYLQGRYDLEVIDVYQQPQLLQDDDIVAVPTLIKELPLPLQQWVGDLSKNERVLIGLGLVPKTPGK